VPSRSAIVTYALWTNQYPGPAPPTHDKRVFDDHDVDWQILLPEAAAAIWTVGVSSYTRKFRPTNVVYEYPVIGALGLTSCVNTGPSNVNFSITSFSFMK
jgi:hypothetical protein